MRPKLYIQPKWINCILKQTSKETTVSVFQILTEPSISKHNVKNVHDKIHNII